MESSEEEPIPDHPRFDPAQSAVTVSLLLREISTIFWQDPLHLWGPILLADLVKSGIVFAGTFLSRIVVNSLLSHSVLTGQVGLSPSDHFPPMIAWIAGSVKLTSYALSFFVYSIAFAYVASRVNKMDRMPTAAAAGRQIPLHTKALKLTAVLVGLLVSVGCLWALLIASLPRAILSSKNAPTLVLILLTAIAARFAAKPFLSFASKENAQRFRPDVIRHAWITLGLGEAFSMLLYLAFLNMGTAAPANTPLWFFYVRSMAFSFATAVPFIPMMVAITRLTEDRRPQNNATALV